MLELFMKGYKTRGSIVTAGNLTWYKTRIQENITRLYQYYSSSPRAVFGNNLLAQILKISGAASDNDVFGVYDLAWARNRFIVNGLKMTSDEAQGTMKHLSIYNTADSLNISYPEYTSPYESVKQWGHLRPVKTLWLDSPYVNMDVPVLAANMDNGDFSAITVDIPMLSLMYKGFNGYRKSLALTQDFTAVLGEEHFVAMYALPSVVESQVDITCTSALMNLYYGKYDDRRKVDTPIYLASYSDDYRKIAYDILNRIEGSRMQYQHVLQSIPAVFSDSAASALVLPDVSNTIQIDWALFMSRLAVIEFLLDVGGSTGRRANQGSINLLVKHVKAMKGRGFPFKAMTQQLADTAENAITRILKL